MTAPTVWLTDHAFTRLRERFGWTGSRRAAAAQLAAFRGVRAAVALGVGARVDIPSLGMRVVLDGAQVITVMEIRDRLSPDAARNLPPRKGPAERRRPVGEQA
jgi:hypothetical protein